MGYNINIDVDVLGGTLQEITEQYNQAMEWNKVSDRSIFKDEYVKKMDLHSQKMAHISEEDWAMFNRIFSGFFGKCYGWRTSLMRISKAFPLMTFHATWRGEDTDDWGHAQFRAGQFRSAKAVLPPLENCPWLDAAR